MSFTWFFQAKINNIIPRIGSVLYSNIFSIKFVVLINKAPWQLYIAENGTLIVNSAIFKQQKKKRTLAYN